MIDTEKYADNLKPNSYRSKDNASKEKEKENKIIKGKAKTKKKGFVTGFFENFFHLDESKDIKSYVFLDILIPAAKNALSEILHGGTDILLYGDSKPKNRNNGASYVSYNKYSDNNNRSQSGSSNRTRLGYAYDDVILETRDEAEDILRRMDEIVATYGMVTVADLYDLAGISGKYTDNKYGWVNIRNAEIVRIREGFLIKMPKAIPID